MVTVACVLQFPDPMWLGPTIAYVIMLFVCSLWCFGVAPRTLGQQHARARRCVERDSRNPVDGKLGPIASLLILIGNAVTPGSGYREGPSLPKLSCANL